MSLLIIETSLNVSNHINMSRLISITITLAYGIAYCLKPHAFIAYIEQLHVAYGLCSAYGTV